MVAGEERKRAAGAHLLSQLIVGPGERPAQDHDAQYRDGTVG